MKKTLFSIVALVTLITAPITMLQTGLIAGTKAALAANGDGMAKFKVVRAKLTSSMADIKDLDQLDKVGMPKADIARMKRATELKVQWLTDEALDLIKSL